MRALLLGLTLLISQTALAETTSQEASMVWLAAKMLFGVATIVVLIVSMGFFAKRFNLTGVSNTALLSVVATLPVSNKDKIALIKVKNKQILVGLSPGNINTLHVFDDEDQPTEETALETTTVKTEQEKTFSKFLRDILKNEDKTGE